MCSIIKGKAIALLDAMKELERRGLKSVLDAIHHSCVGASDFSTLIFIIKCLLFLHPNFEVKFTKRQMNMVAHTFARAVTSWSSRYIFELLPLRIAPFLFNEMM
jgi:hypothetical protein